MAKNEFINVGKIIHKIVTMKVDIISKLIILSVFAVPLVIIGMVLATIYILCNVKLPKQKQTLKAKDEKVEPIPPTSTIYYEVRKYSSNKYSLTQYVNFFVEKNNEFVDVTKSLKSVYPELKYYSGLSPVFKNTVVLKDYDIVKLQKNLGRIKLVRTVREVK